MASPQVVEQLAHDRTRFVSFVRARVGDRATAEDIVQNAMLAAVRDTHDVHGAELSRWFYRVLRNGIIDRHRRTATEARAMEAFGAEPTARIQQTPRRICGCVRTALDQLEPKLRAALEAVELTGLKPGAFALEAGISPANASVRLHRARRQLGERLKGLCGSCSLDGCADCDCSNSDRSL